MMAGLGFRLRHIVFHGPNRVPASVHFGPGLNVVYGASETGKSFVVEAIDFMLGGRPPLRDISERVGYDRILLGLEVLDGGEFTLLRSADGGAFRLYSGLHGDLPREEFEFRELADQHSERNENNLSRFLLETCGLDGKRVRKNKQGETHSLSFRNLARLLIVTETEIVAQRSPLSDGNPTTDTPNFATFKLLLTGVDDTALASGRERGIEDESRDVQLELLDQLLDEYRQRLKDLTKSPEELEDQLRRLDSSLSQHTEILRTTEADYRRLTDRRRDLRKKIEEGRDRRAEIEELLERFALLDRHYVSDVARLRGIEEGGSLFQVLGQATCPLCGAAPEHHRKEVDCDGNIEAVVVAARSESAKIGLLQSELGETIKELRREAGSFDRRLPKVEEELRSVTSELDRLIAPKLSKLRNTYADLADKRGEVREALSLLRTIQDVEARRLKIENKPEDQPASAVSEGDLPTVVAEAFAQQVESILKAWHFPDAERVHFDPKTRDGVIAGKARAARGKGLRAITHAAFTIGLLDYCRSKSLPHPGFVILDSPLLTYREPEGAEDDLSGTDLKEKFYDYLSELSEDRQVIIVENTDPPQQITLRPLVVMFSKNPHTGRYGFFPTSLEQQLPLPESSS
jgi:predicted nuclease with TOPRIM domain